jgi:polyisoprenoid-binding protein YceI
MITINRIRQWLISGLLASLPVFANSTVPAWQITPTDSKLSFTATQNGAPVTGVFKTFTGAISFDLNDLKDSKADIIIDISSITASYADLTATLITPDWFNAKIFPKAEFKTTEFSKTGDKTYQAMGTLTIRDKTAPVILTFTAVESPKDTMVVEGSTLLKRTTFGVGQGEWASTTEVKDDVTVNFKLIAKKK